ncbi:hypothetical protein BH20ACI3_BH20ACI3_03170 [soil metagenome]
MNHPESTQMEAIQAFLAHRQFEILGSICKLVEIESPSGDFEGSRAVVDLLVDGRAERRFDFMRPCEPESIPVFMMWSLLPSPAPTHVCAEKRSLSVAISITNGPARTITRAAAWPSLKWHGHSAS